jgi:hypothetical protein
MTTGLVSSATQATQAYVETVNQSSTTTMTADGTTITTTQISQNFSTNMTSGTPAANPSTSITPAAIPDMRVRLRAQIGQETQVYGSQTDPDNILGILYNTRGMVFPYTPTVTIEQNVDYKSMELTHTNWDINSYTRTPGLTLTVSGKFTVQNQYEGQYLIAALHFLRTCSKMYFGEQAKDKAGLPPPVLNFSGYGTYMFGTPSGGLMCVLKNHSYSLDESVDYYNVQIGDSITRVPVLLTVTCTIGIQQTPYAMRKDFDLDAFRTGALMRAQKGWI